jgi:UMF1 family MFS transporter
MSETLSVHDRRTANPPDHWLNRRTVIWASYDVAGSTYFGVVPIVLFPIFFQTVVVPGPKADLYWGLVISSALYIAAFAAPFLGVFADRHNARWPALVVATAACCMATSACFWLEPHQAFRAAACFIVAHVGYLLATSLYESYLPQIATPQASGRVSGFGWAIGFLGGIAAILAVLPLTQDETAPEFLERYQWSFVVVGAMFALLSIPAIWAVRLIIEMPKDGQPASRTTVWSSIRKWREHREVFKLIVASYLINDALFTISIFAAKFFSGNFGSSVRELLLLLLAYHVIGLPSTLAFGFLADRWSHKRAISLSLAVWVLALGIMVFCSGSWVPFTVVALLGLVQGATSAMLRSLFAQLVPVKRSGEFFGFNTFSGRLSAALGPLVYGAISFITGSERLALLSLLVFILAGGLVLATVNVRHRE